MELVVRKTDLLRELQLFQGIVERKNTIPILANVLLDAKGNQVKLLATDPKLASQHVLRVCHEERRAHAPAKKLYEIVKALPETDVRIEEDKNGVKVAADRFDSRMQSSRARISRRLPESSGTFSAKLSRDVVKQMIAKTQFAITGEDTRYFLNGALFILEPDSMTLVSTDGHRLALISVPREKAEGGSRKRTRSASSCRARRCSNSDGCSGKAKATSSTARREPSVLRYRRAVADLAEIDGQFPAFERVIPKSNDKRVEFDRDRLTSAVRRVALSRTNVRAPSSSRSTRARSRLPRAARSLAKPRKSHVDYTAAPVTICSTPST